MSYLSSYLSWRAVSKHGLQLLCVLIDSNAKNIFFNFKDRYLDSSQMKLPSLRKFSWMCRFYDRLTSDCGNQIICNSFKSLYAMHKKNLKGAEANLYITFQQ